MNDDSGFVAIWLAVAVLLVLGGAWLLVVVATDVHAAAARARTAADAAALAGMAESPIAGGSGDPAGAARNLAAANGGTVVELDRDGWPFRFAVTVRVAFRAPLLRRLAPDAVIAEAAAGVRPPRSPRGASGQPLDR